MHSDTKCPLGCTTALLIILYLSFPSTSTKFNHLRYHWNWELSGIILGQLIIKWGRQVFCNQMLCITFSGERGQHYIPLKVRNEIPHNSNGLHTCGLKGRNRINVPRTTAVYVYLLYNSLPWLLALGIHILRAHLMFYGSKLC